jgi:hypothetical protein
MNNKKINGIDIIIGNTSDGYRSKIIDNDLFSKNEILSPIAYEEPIEFHYDNIIKK